MVGGNSCKQRLVIGDRARLDELANLGVEVLADAGNREPCRGRQVGDPLGGVGDGLRGVAIRADLERILALDLEQVADFGEHARDGEVVEAHSAGLKAHGLRQNRGVRFQCSS